MDLPLACCTNYISSQCFLVWFCLFWVFFQTGNDVLVCFLETAHHQNLNSLLSFSHGEDFFLTSAKNFPSVAWAIAAYPVTIHPLEGSTFNYSLTFSFR